MDALDKLAAAVPAPAPKVHQFSVAFAVHKDPRAGGNLRCVGKLAIHPDKIVIEGKTMNYGVMFGVIGALIGAATAKTKIFTLPVKGRRLRVEESGNLYSIALSSGQWLFFRPLQAPDPAPMHRHLMQRFGASVEKDQFGSAFHGNKGLFLFMAIALGLIIIGIIILLLFGPKSPAT
ncbi:MAG: hypothetical protein ABFD92_20245 [Planctomycetaceae bacterium]|nr:hypothetical protein [Planctomycetaceae bacterium]